MPEKKALWLYYELTLQIRNRLCGGVPKSPDTIRNWIKASVKDENILDTLIAQALEGMDTKDLTEEQIAELAKASWCGFMSDENGLYLEGRCLKACLKEAANVTKEIMGITAYKARVAEHVQVMEDKIPLGTHEPSGSYDGMIHAINKSGPFSALKRVDYVEQPILICHLQVLNQRIKRTGEKAGYPPTEYLPALLEYAAENGLGADRSQGYGKFDWCLEPLDAKPEITR